MKTQYLTDILTQALIRKIQSGIVNGIHLDAKEVNHLLYILRTSISIEPFLEIFAQLIKKTYLEGYDSNGDEGTTKN